MGSDFPMTRHELALADDNSEISVIASGATIYASGSFYQGARNSTIISSDITNYGAVGCFVVTDMTVASGSPVFLVNLDGKDSASGKYFNLISGAALTTSGMTQVLRMHPNFTSGALMGSDLVFKDALPRVYRIKIVDNTTSGAWGTFTTSVLPILK